MCLYFFLFCGFKGNPWGSVLYQHLYQCNILFIQYVMYSFPFFLLNSLVGLLPVNVIWWTLNVFVGYILFMVAKIERYPLAVNIH